MKKTAILVNTCRGPVVDEVALYKALRDETIMAAGLDVMVEEPPKAGSRAVHADERDLQPALGRPEPGTTTRSGGATPSTIASGWARGSLPFWIVPELR